MPSEIEKAQAAVDDLEKAISFLNQRKSENAKNLVQLDSNKNALEASLKQPFNPDDKEAISDDINEFIAEVAQHIVANKEQAKIIEGQLKELSDEKNSAQAELDRLVALEQKQTQIPDVDPTSVAELTPSPKKTEDNPSPESPKKGGGSWNPLAKKSPMEKVEAAINQKEKRLKAGTSTFNTVGRMASNVTQKQTGRKLGRRLSKGLKDATGKKRELSIENSYKDIANRAANSAFKPFKKDYMEKTEPLLKDLKGKQLEVKDKKKAKVAITKKIEELKSNYQGKGGLSSISLNRMNQFNDLASITAMRDKEASKSGEADNVKLDQLVYLYDLKTLEAELSSSETELKEAEEAELEANNEWVNEVEVLIELEPYQALKGTADKERKQEADLTGTAEKNLERFKGVSKGAVHLERIKELEGEIKSIKDNDKTAHQELKISAKQNELDKELTHYDELEVETLLDDHELVDFANDPMAYREALEKQLDGDLAALATQKEVVANAQQQQDIAFQNLSSEAQKRAKEEEAIAEKQKEEAAEQARIAAGGDPVAPTADDPTASTPIPEPTGIAKDVADDLSKECDRKPPEHEGGVSFSRDVGEMKGAISSNLRSDGTGDVTVGGETWQNASKDEKAELSKAFANTMVNENKWNNCNISTQGPNAIPKDQLGAIYKETMELAGKKGIEFDFKVDGKSWKPEAPSATTSNTNAPAPNPASEPVVDTKKEAFKEAVVAKVNEKLKDYAGEGTQTLPENDRARAIQEAIQEVAKDNNQSVLIEGVETGTKADTEKEIFLKREDLDGIANDVTPKPGPAGQSKLSDTEVDLIKSGVNPTVDDKTRTSDSPTPTPTSTPANDDEEDDAEKTTRQSFGSGGP